MLPSNVLHLLPWKLTNPDATEVTQPKLMTHSSSSFSVREHQGRQGVVFRSWTGGSTTPHTKYTRSELRQMKRKGKKPAAWNSRLRSRVMSEVMCVTVLPGTRKPELCCAQIHNAKDDVIEVRIEERNGHNVLLVQSTGENDTILDNNYVLGTIISLQVVASRTGISVSYNGSSFVKVSKKAGSGWYFKTGCYIQTTEPKCFGEVIIFDLAVA